MGAFLITFEDQYSQLWDDYGGRYVDDKAGTQPDQTLKRETKSVAESLAVQ